MHGSAVTLHPSFNVLQSDMMHTIVLLAPQGGSGSFLAGTNALPFCTNTCRLYALSTSVAGEMQIHLRQEALPLSRLPRWLDRCPKQDDAQTWVNVTATQHTHQAPSAAGILGSSSRRRHNPQLCQPARCPLPVPLGLLLPDPPRPQPPLLLPPPPPPPWLIGCCAAPVAYTRCATCCCFSISQTQSNQVSRDEFPPKTHVPQLITLQLIAGESLDHARQQSQPDQMLPNSQLQHTWAPCSSGSHNGRIDLFKPRLVRPHGRIQCHARFNSSSSSSTDRSLAFCFIMPATAAAPRSYLHQQQQQSRRSVRLRATPGKGPCLALLAIAAALGPPASPTASHSCPLPTGLGDDELDVAVFRFTLGIPGFDDSNIPRVVGTVVAALVAINHVISYGSNPAPPAQVGGWTAARGRRYCSCACVRSPDDPGTAVLLPPESASSLPPSAFPVLHPLPPFTHTHTLVVGLSWVMLGLVVP